MRKHILIAVLALAAIGGTTGVATAKQGADDPAGHVRQGADDVAGHVRHSGTAESKVRAHRRARHGRGADDSAGHVRHSGADDGPNHG